MGMATKTGSGIRMGKRKEFTNNMMETTRNIFLKTKKVPKELILIVE